MMGKMGNIEKFAGPCAQGVSDPGHHPFCYRRFVVVRSTSDRSFLGSRFSSSWTSDFDPILLSSTRGRDIHEPPEAHPAPNYSRRIRPDMGIRSVTGILKSLLFLINLFRFLSDFGIQNSSQNRPPNLSKKFNQNRFRFGIHFQRSSN